MDAGVKAGRRVRLLAAFCALGLVAATPSPSGPQEPAFELHRNAAAGWFDPGQVNPLFVLVIGSDVREGDPTTGLADSLHIIALNTTTLQGTMIGIPRDTYVNVPGIGGSKINAALQAGGPERVVETVTAITGITFHYWALTEFSRFRDLVDRLGGVDVDVPYAMSDAFSGAFFDPGVRHMNGAELLAFCRNRHGAPGGDLGRSENQGRALLAGLAKFRSVGADPSGVLAFLEAFRADVRSDVPIRDLLALATLGRRIDPASIRNVVVPARTGNVGAQSVVFLEPGANAMFAAVRDDGVL